ncbi:MAG: LOG family protein [Patescibacteria group bacterium]
MDNNICHTTYKYKICVSGAAETEHCGPDAFKLAEEVGKEIVRHDAVLVTGATTGFPYWVAKGAKEQGGIVIGLSPAATEQEHIKRFDLPTEYHDLIIYTGFNYSGRNLLLTRAADAIIVGCGRMGTLNEFTIAFEDKKPIGILEGDWETDEVLKTLIEKSHRAEEMKGKIVYAKDPKILLDKLIEMVKKDKGRNNHQ